MLSKVQSHNRKVTQETPKNPEIFVKSNLQLSLSLFQLNIASSLILLETAVIAVLSNDSA